MLERLLARFQVPDPQDDRQPTVQLAAAVLLFEVAWADHQISAVELHRVRDTLTRVFGLDAATVEELLAESRSQHEDSVGIHRFTRALVDAWTPDQRFELLVQLWRLALCDAVLDKYEDATIRKIAELLYVSHGRFIAAKRKARQLAAADRNASPPAP